MSRKAWHCGLRLVPTVAIISGHASRVARAEARRRPRRCGARAVIRGSDSIRRGACRVQTSKTTGTHSTRRDAAPRGSRDALPPWLPLGRISGTAGAQRPVAAVTVGATQTGSLSNIASRVGTWYGAIPFLKSFMVQLTFTASATVRRARCNSVSTF